MTSDNSDAQDRREAKAAGLRDRARMGSEARANYEAAQQATEDKTVRLKALRLVKEQTDKKAAMVADKMADKKACKKAGKKR
jgi:hypothetical protein